MNYDQARWTADGTRREPLLSEKGMARETVDGGPLPDELTRDELTLPSPSEPEIARHYTRLAQMNYGVDSGPIPLGSCTMKYNPPMTRELAAHDAGAVHPDRPDATLQGTLAVQHALQEQLAAIGGMDAVSLQPPAGAAGEFAGILIARAYHAHENGAGPGASAAAATGSAESTSAQPADGTNTRSEVLIPDAAHGTNFASAALAGYDVVSIPSGEDGRVDLAALEAAVGPETAALMLTNPNTLGLFERDIETIADVVHDAGGLLYYDGANLNALLGRARPGDMGFDVMHYNVHKTFATPHGGGGPGAGPVGVREGLARYLPGPRVERRGGRYQRVEPDRSIGKVHGFEGNWLALVQAHAYVARLGASGLRDASATAVLNANYLAERIEYDVPFRPFHHEFVASAGEQDAADVAKRMLDHGVHPPTTKWPEIVDEALMTEPTEAESRRSLDALAAAFDAVAGEDDATLAEAPRSTAAPRIDQVGAARSPRLSWRETRE